jgi:riboflavin biosynthesis pyrimidine reductase
LALYGRRPAGATLPAAAMRAGLIDEYAMVSHPVLVGGGTRSSPP